MKASTVVVLFGSVMSCAAVAATGRTDRVDRVVVFADRAEVTRVAPARCTNGTASVLFASLPDAIDLRTLRGEADGDAVFVGVTTATAALGEDNDKEVAALNEQIQKLDDELTSLQRSQADDNERGGTWSSYGNWARTVISEDLRQAKPDLGRWEQLLTTLQNEAVSSSKGRVLRDAQIRTLARSRERLANRLDRLNPSRAPTNINATVAVRCGSSATPMVRLAYVVPAATWGPEYDVRFTPPQQGRVGEGNAALTIAGVVRQASGEDWDDVEVWLSTAKPKLGGEAPMPNPIYVQGAPEDKQKTLVSAQETRDADLKGGGRGGSGAANAELEDGGKSVLLKLPKRVTVHADGRPYWFPVDEVTTKARSSLVATPALSPWVYQVVVMKNPAGHALLAGPVHVFRGGTFVGDASTEYRAPGEPFELSLGIDEEVRLQRQDLQDEKRAAGLLSGSQSVVQTYRTILQNRSNQDVTVEIREQVPVSKNADIVVTIDAAKTTAGYRLDGVRGHLSWQASMKKGAKSQHDLGYTITLPKEWAMQ
jgi:uncharacterized protein (TIGR02231 family)